MDGGKRTNPVSCAIPVSPSRATSPSHHPLALFSGETELLEARAAAEAKAREASAAAAALLAAKGALASNAHAHLLLRLGARGVGTLALRLVLREWRHVITVMEAHKEVASLSPWDPTHHPMGAPP